MLTPDDPLLVSQSVVLLAGTGRYDEAEAQATARLEAAPGGAAAATLEAQVEAVRDMRRRMN
jgi:hypothetical protein